jgi:PDZ domain-containing protein
MRRQATTLFASAGLALVVFFVGMSLPVPSVRLVPGPVTDTLSSSGNTPLITIKDHQTHPTDGKLYLVTVGEYGGPGKNLSADNVLAGWWNDRDAVVPVSVLYGPSETAEDAAQQDAEAMDLSQIDAKLAALRYLGYDLSPNGVLVTSIEKTSTALGKLHTSDIIVGVDSSDVTDANQLLTVLGQFKVGDQATLHVKRGDKQIDVPITLQTPRADNHTPSIGIGVVTSYQMPFQIDIQLDNVGGPSAGMAFALGIIDKLSEGSLTGGRVVAGTGTISADGSVGPIGGIEQKMAGARKAGATVFLVPKDNCAAAVKAVPKGLRLVKVSTLSGAVDALNKIRAGESGVPSC